MVWGIESENGCIPEILKPIGLFSYGGSSNPKNGRLTYYIYSIDKNVDFKYEIDDNKIKDIETIFKKYLRIKKLNQIFNC